MKALLLDLDRTLVDVQTFTDYAAAVSDLEDRFGQLPGSEDVPDTYWRKATVAAMEALVAWSGTARWQEASDLIETYEAAAVPASKPMPGLDEFLSATGDRRRAVVTLMGGSAAQDTLAAHRIGITALVPRLPDLRPKPAPDQLRAGVGLLDCRPREAVMIGDSSWDREAAVAAGIEFIGVGDADFGPDVLVASGLLGVLDLID
ncbi:MAG: HAD hydrolase-like protein [Actinomycetota bacterium]|nr:HAD hydrolase-like protein [Actinomycetota bacterium]